MGWGSFREKYIDKPLDIAGDLITVGHGEEMGEILTLQMQKEAGQGVRKAGEDTVDDITGKTGEEAAKEAASTQAGALMEQLNYLKEINKMPQQYKEESLAKLNDIYSGGASGIEAQQGIIDQAKASPYYQEMMGNLKAGEEGVARASSVTGGLRSGNVNEALYDYNVQAKNQALSGSYNKIMGGIEGLAGLGTNEQQIGQVYGDIGEAKAAGITGAAQSRQQGTQNIINTGLGIAGLFI